MTELSIDWQLISEFESRFEMLISKLFEQYWHLLNDGEQQDILATEQKLTRLFKDPRLTDVLEKIKDQINSCEQDLDARILTLLQRIIRSETVARSPILSTIKNEIRQTTLGYTCTINGREYSTSELFIILRDSPDRSMRQNAYTSLQALSAHLEPQFKSGWKIYRDLVQDAGYDSFIDFQLETMEVDRAKLDNSLDSFFKAVQPVRTKMIEYMKIWAGNCALNAEDIQPWDTQFIMNTAQKDLKPYFPSYKAVEVLTETLQTLGFNVRNLPITIDQESKRHKKESFAFCANIKVPNDIRVSVAPSDGLQFYRILFHEYGHALHFASIEEDQVLLKRSDTPALNETMSLFSELIMCDDKWPSRFVHLDDDLQSTFRMVNKMQSLRWLYSVMAGIRFELMVYDDPERDIRSLRREISRKYSFFEFDTEFSMGEGEFIVFMESPLYLTGYFLANINAVRIYNHLCREKSLFDNNPGHTGQFMRDNFYKHGGRYPWYVLMKNALPSTFSMDEFVDHFRIDFN